jgi:hypothetical protein
MPLTSTSSGYFPPNPSFLGHYAFLTILIKCNFTKFIPSNVLFGLFGEKEVTTSIS